VKGLGEMYWGCVFRAFSYEVEEKGYTGRKSMGLEWGRGRGRKKIFGVGEERAIMYADFQFRVD
jgi:hypothetical protein